MTAEEFQNKAYAHARTFVAALADDMMTALEDGVPMNLVVAVLNATQPRKEVYLKQLMDDPERRKRMLAALEKHKDAA